MGQNKVTGLARFFAVLTGILIGVVLGLFYEPRGGSQALEKEESSESSGDPLINRK